jgi:glycosyltransferase involved in cell wall biosynthesis
VTSSCSEGPGSITEVAVLKSPDFADWQTRNGDGWQLPYRMDYLGEHGLRLQWTDALYRPGWPESRAAAAIRRAEALTAPFAQTALMARTIAAAPITLAMFESEANALAAARRVWPGRRTSILAVVTCWLAQVLDGCRPARRAAYRWAYRSVDRLYYFSRNQGPVLAEHLELGADRLRYLPFGVDVETFTPSQEEDGDYILVVGRDSGRDWRTLFSALEGIDIPVKLCCRPRDVAGLRVPARVEMLGYVDRTIYRHLLGRARVVAIATKPLLYPSGQSVLLESMAMARAVVVTGTPALADYIADGESALVVPPGDAGALRRRLIEAASTDDLRAYVGRNARKAVERSFSAQTMWATVADDLLELSRRPSS